MFLPSLYKMQPKKVAPWSFSLFSQQPFVILIWSITDLFPEYG